MEIIFIFFLVVIIDCVLLFGFYYVGIVLLKYSELKLYNFLFENYKIEINDILIWKKFYFWKKKRDFWIDDVFDFSFRFFLLEN